MISRLVRPKVRAKSSSLIVTPQPGAVSCHERRCALKLSTSTPSMSKMTPMWVMNHLPYWHRLSLFCSQS